MVWAAVIPAVASLAGAAASYFGGQNANQNTAQMAQNQMNFQQDQMNQQQAYNTAMVAGANAQNWDMFNWSKDFASEQANVNRDYAMKYFNATNQNTWDMARYQTGVQQQNMATAMQFDEHMSSTAYQRAVQDMRAAGLNPMLAYQQGGASSPTINPPGGGSGSFGPGQVPGASAPSGSTAGVPGLTAHGGAMATMRDVITPAVSTAMQASRAFSQLEQLQAGVDQTKAQTQVSLASADQVRANTALQVAQTLTETERPGLVMEQLRNLWTNSRLQQAQTITERGRPALVGAQASSAAATATQTQSETENLRNWGRSGPIANIGTMGEAVGRRIYSAGENAARQLMELYRTIR